MKKDVSMDRLVYTKDIELSSEFKSPFLLVSIDVFGCLASEDDIIYGTRSLMIWCCRNETTESEQYRSLLQNGYQREKLCSVETTGW